MTNLRVEVPLLIMILQIMMKLVIHRRASIKCSLDLIYELPTNFIFLSISFSIVFIFLKEPIKPESVILFIKLLILSIIVVAIFRECKYLADSSLNRTKIFFLILLILINFLISVHAIFKASDQLIRKPIYNTEQFQNIKEIDKCN